MTASGEAVPIRRVVARLNVGGPAMHVVHLAAAMDAGPWRTRPVAASVPPTEGDMGYFADARGVEVLHVPELSREIDLAGDLRALWARYRLSRRERPAGVHTHTAKAGAGTVIPPAAGPAAWADALVAATAGPPPAAATRRGVGRRFSVERRVSDLGTLCRRGLARA